MLLILGIGVTMLWLGEGRARWFVLGIIVVAILIVIAIFKMASCGFVE